MTVGHQERQRFGDHWCTHCRRFKLDPRLSQIDPGTKIAALASFAQDVRDGEFSAGTSVRVQTVQVALRAIGTTCELDGLPNPCYTPGQGKYLKPIEHQLEGYRREDPPPKRKLAILLHLIHNIMINAYQRLTPRTAPRTNLYNVAFYYLL